jgi:hypothetical protein
MIVKKLALLGAAIVIVGACSKLPSEDAKGNAATGKATETTAASTPAAAATRTRGVLESVGKESLALKTYDGK